MTWFCMFALKNRPRLIGGVVGVVCLLLIGIYIKTSGAKYNFNLTLPELSSSEPVSIEQWSGQIVYMDVWATWCKPCIEILPQIQILADLYKDKNIQFVGINQDSNPVTAAAFLESHNIVFQQLYDPLGEVLVRLNLKGIPASVLLDESGHIHYLNEGASADSMSELQLEIDKLLSASNQ